MRPRRPATRSSATSQRTGMRRRLQTSATRFAARSSTAAEYGSAQSRLVWLANPASSTPIESAVAAARMPRDVRLADALDHRIGVDAVVGRHLGDRRLEPARADLGGVGPLRDLHRVDHHDVDRPAGRAGHVGALDERVCHATALPERRSRAEHSADPVERARIGDMASSESRASRLTAVRRSEERVTPLELFFDLVFVLAVTQCTALMANDADLAGTAPRPPRAGRPLVVMGRLCVADERRRPRGGRRPTRDVRRDGRVPRRRACVPERLRRRRASRSPARTGSSASPTSGCS